MDKDFSFEEIVKQNQNRIYYHIHKLHIRDPHNEFYVEGLYALWKAYKKYEPQKGPMATYSNYTIGNHLIDQIRKEEREKQKKWFIGRHVHGYFLMEIAKQEGVTEQAVKSCCWEFRENVSREVVVAV